MLLSYEGLGTVIHRYAVIADEAIIGGGATIGGRAAHEGVPTIEEGAMIGAGAKVLGPIRNWAVRVRWVERCCFR